MDLKKIVITGALAAVVFGCVLVAGCTAGDPFLGTWKLTEPTELGVNETEGYDMYLTFLRNGAGLQTFNLEGTQFDEDDMSSSYVSGSSTSTAAFTWEKKDDKTRTAYFSDGVADFVYDATKKTLTSKWGVYTKY